MYKSDLHFTPEWPLSQTVAQHPSLGPTSPSPVLQRGSILIYMFVILCTDWLTYNHSPVVAKIECTYSCSLRKLFLRRYCLTLSWKISPCYHGKFQACTSFFPPSWVPLFLLCKILFLIRGMQRQIHGSTKVIVSFPQIIESRQSWLGLAPAHHGVFRCCSSMYTSFRLAAKILGKLGMRIRSSMRPRPMYRDWKFEISCTQGTGSHSYVQCCVVRCNDFT